MVETRNGTHTNNNNGGPQNVQNVNTNAHPNGAGNGVPDLTQLLQAIAAAAAANMAQQQNARVPLRHQMTRSQLLDTFCKRRPPIFFGEPDPAVAEAWLKQFTKLLEVLNVVDVADRIALASFQLQGEADHWWDLLKTTQNVETMTWQNFVDAFNGKYFPAPVKQAMIQEFLVLKQGSRNVTQYAARFEELARHAEDVVKTDEAKARRFEWGLDTKIRGIVMSHDFRTYAQVVKCALMIERETVDTKGNGELQRASGPSAGGPIRNNNNIEYTAPKPYTQHIPQPQPPMQPWENSNQGQNQNLEGRCYHCKQEGHFKFSCPQLNGSKSSSYGGQQQAHSKPMCSENHHGGLKQPRVGWNKQLEQPRQYHHSQEIGK